ncbi:MAG TPA: hypothetical protein VFW31_17985 [Candidatus Angelobacter sp.]|nr:hypothetical protein [Candidatus Angelobacter sp.]
MFFLGLGHLPELKHVWPVSQLFRHFFHQGNNFFARQLVEIAFAAVISQRPLRPAPPPGLIGFFALMAVAFSGLIQTPLVVAILLAFVLVATHVVAAVLVMTALIVAVLVLTLLVVVGRISFVHRIFLINKKSHQTAACGVEVVFGFLHLKA